MSSHYLNMQVRFSSASNANSVLNSLIYKVSASQQSKVSLESWAATGKYFWEYKLLFSLEV